MTPSVDLGEFEFAAGESLPLTVAYETYGEYDGDNAVLVCHALTGSHHVAGANEGNGGPDADRAGSEANASDPAAPYDPAGQAGAWWADVVGPGKPIDTERYFVVSANVPGSCYGTTGPASVDPATGEPYGSDFPTVTVGDWTRAQARLLDALGIDRLHAVVGGSVGGMNVLEWAKRFPDRVDRVVPVATAARLGPQALALDATARRAITDDPHWAGGDYYGDGPDPDAGLAQARRIGHVMYLSEASMDRRFGRTPATDPDPAWAPDADADPTHADATSEYRVVASYLDYNARSFTDRFDANSYLRLLRAMDEYDLAAGHDSVADALVDFDGTALVISFTGDWHFPVERSRRLVAGLREAGVETAHEVVASDYGHDAFLVEPETFARPLARFLAGDPPDTAGTDAGQAPVHAGLFR